jgi:hypothetical protein
LLDEQPAEGVLSAGILWRKPVCMLSHLQRAGISLAGKYVRQIVEQLGIVSLGSEQLLILCPGSSEIADPEVAFG